MDEPEAGPGDRRTARVPAAEAGQRLDVFLAAHFPSWSRRQLSAAVRQGHVRVNGRRARPGQALVAGDRLDLPVWNRHFATVQREETDRRRRHVGADEIRVVHRDDVLLVVDKPAGMPVHAGAGTMRTTLLERLMDDVREGFGLVHRLDRDTTGLVCLARGADVRARLAAAFAADGAVAKTYEAIVSGVPDEPLGTIDAPLRAPPQGGRAEVDPVRGKAATTNWTVLERFTRAARLRVEPSTGRTHQIRAHLLHIGHPLLVDPLYGGRRALRIPDPRGGRAVRLGRTPLHAARLAFEHPATGAACVFESPLPGDLREVLERLRIVAARGAERGGLPPPPAPT